MKALGKAISEMPQTDIAQLEADGQFTFAQLDGAPVVTLDDVEIIAEDVPGWLVTNDSSLTVALDISLTPELINEGMAREIVKRIQNIRKGNQYEITDKVDVTLTRDAAIEGAVNEFGSYISSQVLASSLTLADTLDDADAMPLEIEGLDAKVIVRKSKS